MLRQELRKRLSCQIVGFLISCLFCYICFVGIPRDDKIQLPDGRRVSVQEFLNEKNKHFGKRIVFRIPKIGKWIAKLKGIKQEKETEQESSDDWYFNDKYREEY
eukprot:TRINITY_DN10370_c1_g1_i1.p5 TRINITY_DN10370_c1_g1~~TRINITY_DN10370_c1_g1_i1.p5  ORF type:complete len:104 (-),score=4.12 TRINITY_DN10370_c1_g1_i1:997-1308(-)